MAEHDPPRRPAPRLRVRWVVVAVLLCAYPIAYVWKNPDGPFSTLADNRDPGWAQVDHFEPRTIVLKDGRRVVYDADAVPAFVAPNVGLRAREQRPDGTMGAWRAMTSWGYLVELSDGDRAGPCTVTVWVQAPVGFGSHRTWDPRERHTVPTRRRHHVGRARVEGAAAGR